MSYCYPNHFRFINSETADFALFKLSKCTNLHIKDPACCHIVHILQHQTSCPTTKSTSNTIVSDPKHDLLPFAVGKYGISTKPFTLYLHYANGQKEGFVAYAVWALGVLCSIGSNKSYQMKFPDCRNGLVLPPNTSHV
jgi:hypothetical protein